MSLIGIDLGTTGCRSIVVNEDLEILGEAYTEYPLLTLSHGRVEQDADTWWECTKIVMKESIRGSGVDTRGIKGISVSAQGISFVPVDRDCRPLMNAINWLDKRAGKQKAEMLGRVSNEKFFKITGKKACEALVLAKILWLQENQPEVFKSTYKFLTAHDYLVFKLCGETITDHTMASGTQMYDIGRGGWSHELLERFDIDKGMLPGIKRSGTPVGTLGMETAQELGLRSNVKVSVGGQDQKCAALGAGIREGVVTVSLGTAAAITHECDRPVLDELMRIPCHPYLTKGKWVLEGVVGTACASFNWLRDTLFNDRDYRELDGMADSIAPNESPLFFYPHLSGSKGFFYGVSLSTKPGNIVRSVLEGVAYQVRTNIDILEKINRPAQKMIVFGGGAKSSVWCRIIADITGKKAVKTSTPETGAVGAAILAGLGAGVYKTFEEAVAKLQYGEEFEPDSAASKAYDENLTGAIANIPKERSRERVEKLQEAASPYKVVFGVSPEVEGIDRLLPHMIKQGYPAFITHTAANVEQTRKAIESGATHATHFYDVFPYIGDRESGVRGCGTVEAILANPETSVDFILDGEHVEPVAVEVALACKGRDRVCLVTDASGVAGMPPGRYKGIGGYEVDVFYEGGPARIADGKISGKTQGGLAGSGLTMDRAIRNAVKLLGMDVAQAVAMATANPARVLGLQHRKGYVRENYDADMVCLTGI